MMSILECELLLESVPNFLGWDADQVSVSAAQQQYILKLHD
jgi:hypothetical protein